MPNRRTLWPRSEVDALLAQRAQSEEERRASKLRRLHYISDTYSAREVATLIGVPADTVNDCLHQYGIGLHPPYDKSWSTDTAPRNRRYFRPIINALASRISPNPLICTISEANAMLFTAGPKYIRQLLTGFNLHCLRGYSRFHVEYLSDWFRDSLIGKHYMGLNSTSYEFTALRANLDYLSRLAPQRGSTPTRQPRTLSALGCFSVTHPNGDEEVIANLARFCRDYNLSRKRAGAVLSGKRHSYHGFVFKHTINGK